MTKYYFSRMRTVLLVLFALIAFAANSIFCRLGIGGGHIDAVSFSMVRLSSGVALLWLLLSFKRQGSEVEKVSGSWKSAGFLFTYMAAFSFGYVRLQAGLGALVLFALVQLTMIFTEFFQGKRFSLGEWLGVLLAFGGFVFLMLPSELSVDYVGVALMAVSGMAWGWYTLAGKGKKNPLRETAGNFLRALPFMSILWLSFMGEAQATWSGVGFAVLSGALASGVGYAVWYYVLKDLKGIQAAVCQLLVPVLAIFGGIAFLGESFTLQIGVASAVILGGILMVVLQKSK